MKKRRIVLIIEMIAAVLAAIAMSGCTTPVPVPPAEVTIPVDLLVACPDIEHIEDPATLEVTMKYISSMQMTYTTCAVRHDALIEATKPKKK